MASSLRLNQREEAIMIQLMKKLVMFRIGQKTSRGLARGIGLGAIAPIVGLIGGTRYMRKHS